MLGQRKDLLSGLLRVVKCSRIKFEVLIVNVFFCKILASQILR